MINPVQNQAIEQAQAPQPMVSPQDQAPQQPLQIPNPAATLARSQQSFPDVPIDVLTGRLASTEIGGFIPQLETVHAQQGSAGSSLLVLGTDAERKIALLPTDGVISDNPAETVRSYVEFGQAIYQQIVAGNFADRPSNKTEVACLMWYLQALASSRAAESSASSGLADYKEGAIVIEDPDHRLEAFLYGDNKSYERASSHFQEYQKLDGCKPHGIDIRNENIKLPHDRHTVLYQRLPMYNSDETMGTGRTMLFIKMEPHGCRNPLNFSNTGYGTEKSSGGTKRLFSNALEYLAHAGGFVGTLCRKMGIAKATGQDNRERIPSDIKSVYKNLIKNVKTAADVAGLNPIASKTIIDKLSENNVLKNTSGGIKQMLSNIDQIIVQQTNPNIEQHRPLRTLLEEAKGILQNHGPHSRMRTGNEVILCTEDMSASQQLQPFGGQMQSLAEALEISQTLTNREREILQTSFQYQLETNLVSLRTYEPDDTFPTRTALLDSLSAAFTRDTQRGQFRTSSEENAIESDAVTANAKVDTLTGDSTIATALKSICHQGLTADISNRLSLYTNAIYGHDQAQIFPTGRYEYGIYRLENAADGSVAYRLSTRNIDGQGNLSAPSPDPNSSEPIKKTIPASMSITMDVYFRPDGSVSVQITDASYQFTLPVSLHEAAAPQPF